MTQRIVSTIVFAGLILGSVDAFASRARETVMGRGDAGSMLSGAGSFYYDSMYNVFYNPAYVNDFKNWAIIEKGATGAGSQAAMGGFVANIMNFNVGLYFNREDAFGLSGAPNLAGTGTVVGVAQGALANGSIRPIDLVFGGDMGVKWGLGVTYANANGGVAGGSDKESNLTVRAGVSVADFDPFISYRIMGKHEQTIGTVRNENKTKDATVGLRYHYGEWTPYAAYRMGKIESSGVAAVNGDRVKNSSYLAGLGRNVKLGEGARMVYSIAFTRIHYGDFRPNTGNVNSGEANRTILPIDFALEGDLSSWITLRAGLGYRLMDRLSGTQAAVADTTTPGTPVAAGVFGGTNVGSVGDNTTARIGATVHANKFDLDWAVGKGATAGNAAAVDSENFGLGESFFSYASLSYKW